MAELFSRYESGVQLTAGPMTGSTLGVSGVNAFVDRLNSIAPNDSTISGTSVTINADGVISGTNTAIFASGGFTSEIKYFSDSWANINGGGFANNHAHNFGSIPRSIQLSYSISGTNIPVMPYDFDYEIGIGAQTTNACIVGVNAGATNFTGSYWLMVIK